jgi:transposase
MKSVISWDPTKIHMAIDAVGQPVRFILTGGEKADSPQAIPLLRGLRATHVIADKGYDANQVLGFISVQGAKAVIPPRSNRKVQREYDRELYKQRNVIERTFNRLKSWRRIATRYDRRSLYYLAFLHLAAAVTWSS